MIWERPAFSNLHVSHYGSDNLVYDEGSGNTYVVDPVAAFVLGQIAAGPRNTEDIKDSIVENFKDLADSDLNNYLDSLLEALSQQHLIRQTDA